jgi:hypothetical protein
LDQSQSSPLQSSLGHLPLSQVNANILHRPSIPSIYDLTPGESRTAVILELSHKQSNQQYSKSRLRGGTCSADRPHPPTSFKYPFIAPTQKHILSIGSRWSKARDIHRNTSASACATQTRFDENVRASSCSSPSASRPLGFHH